MGDTSTASEAVPGEKSTQKSAAKAPSATLAIVALVLSCVVFVPLVPLVGLVLAIVAVVKSARHPGTARVVAIVAICVAPIAVLFNVGMCAAVAVPSFVKYVKRSKTAEATMNVRRLAEATRAFWETEGRLPAASEWTPAESACEHPDDTYAPDPSRWSVPPWSELKFSVDGPSRYQYRIVQREEGAVAVEAQGDLDCDGVYATWRRVVTAAGVGPLESENDLE